VLAPDPPPRPGANRQTENGEAAKPAATSPPAAAAAAAATTPPAAMAPAATLPGASAPAGPAAADAAPPAPPAGDGREPAKPAAPVVDVAFKRNGDNVSLLFPFPSSTPAAVFSRADTLWLVFDTGATIALGKLDREASHVLKSATVTRHDQLAVVRIKLERPRLVSATAEGATWAITVGGEMTEPTRPVGVSRNTIGSARASIIVSFDDPRRLHRLDDPEAGDQLLVVTALAPARGFVKTQDFVEFRALAASHGLVLQPIADDLGAELAADKIVITRPGGLTLSAAVNAGVRTSGSAIYQPHVLDAQTWGFDRQADFRERSMQLIHAAADAPEGKRAVARADLARFFLAREMAVEAKAVLDIALLDSPATPEDPTALVLRAIANIMMGRLDPALRDLGHPLVGNQHDAPLWRALIYARQGRWNDAREGFRAVGAAVGTLPIDMQRMMLKDMVRAAIEVGDITGAVTQMHEIEAVGIPRELQPSLSLLTGRIAEGLGRIEDALHAYQAAADSWDRPAAAQGRLRELVLQRALGNVERAETITALETIAAVWRGDETEIEALQLLARLYTEQSRYRDAFNVMRTALAAHPNSGMTRRIHEEAAETFDSLFLAGKGDTLPAIDALSLFYDFRDLTPIGRRGDEMIRRLADRLVTVDLLDQAAELLQHQVDHRLQGAARAQVATRLAVVYLMNRKADRALASLRATRSADLSNELRNQRLLLEARALSDLGRHDVALEVVANVPGRETIRLRADILWAGKRWREAAEQLELLYGERWREFEPLNDDERRDILRAGIGFVLGEDTIGRMRLREKYAGRMGDGPDRRAFDVVTAPVGPDAGEATEFREVARAIAATDTLAAFLRDLRARFPDPSAAPGWSPSQAAPRPEPSTTGTTAHPGAESPLPPRPATAPRPTARTAAR
jgi:tetratricopeptide (TPR) repeat protein